MEVSKLLSEPDSQPGIKATVGPSASTFHSPYATRQNTSYTLPPLTTYMASQSNSGSHYGPIRQAPKMVTFPLILLKEEQQQARLPLRVNVEAHDTVESIITTVKNFYGLYGNDGVSFEDARGFTIIPSYDTLVANSKVFVSITCSPNREQGNGFYPRSASPRGLFDNGSNLSDAPLFPQSDAGPYHTRNYSPISRNGPGPHTAYETSVAHSFEGRGRGLYIDTEGAKSYEDADDAASTSVTSSVKPKSEQVSAEISLNNIVTGNRRTGVKFESSVGYANVCENHMDSIVD